MNDVVRHDLRQQNQSHLSHQSTAAGCSTEVVTSPGFLKKIHRHKPTPLYPDRHSPLSVRTREVKAYELSRDSTAHPCIHPISASEVILKEDINGRQEPEIPTHDNLRKPELSGDSIPTRKLIRDQLAERLCELPAEFQHLQSLVETRKPKRSIRRTDCKMLVVV